MSLHDRIMRIEPIGHLSSISRIHFVNARNRAALVAVDADELMAEMAESLDCIVGLVEHCKRVHLANPITGGQYESAKAALTKYNAYKEQ